MVQQYCITYKTCFGPKNAPIYQSTFNCNLSFFWLTNHNLSVVHFISDIRYITNKLKYLLLVIIVFLSVLIIIII